LAREVRRLAATERTSAPSGPTAPPCSAKRRLRIVLSSLPRPDAGRRGPAAAQCSILRFRKHRPGIGQSAPRWTRVLPRV